MGGGGGSADPSVSRACFNHGPMWTPDKRARPESASAPLLPPQQAPALFASEVVLSQVTVKAAPSSGDGGSIPSAIDEGGACSRVNSPSSATSGRIIQSSRSELHPGISVMRSRTRV